MKLEDAIQFLEDEGERKALIYKLKAEEEDSEASRALKKMIQALDADKPSKYVNQINMLQHTFSFLNSSDAFCSFRIVCKSWKRAVDTMRFNRSITLNEERFASLILDYDTSSDLTKNRVRSFFKFIWLHRGLIVQLSRRNSSLRIISKIMKKLRYIRITGFDEVIIPIDFTSFCFTLFHKSQNTLTFLEFNMKGIPTLPAIHLPNVEYCSFVFTEEHDSQIEEFSKFVNTILQNTDNSLKFYLSCLIKAPQIMNHISTTYLENCLFSGSHFASSNLPVKMCYFNSDLTLLQLVQHPSKIEYIDILIRDLQNPLASGWQNYDTLLTLFPNLKGICLTEKQEHSRVKWLDLNKALSFAEEETQQIWIERISYLQSQGIELLTEQNYMAMEQQLLKQFKWGFHFYGTKCQFVPKSFSLVN